MRDDGNRALLLALPLPLAQAWRRALYVEHPSVQHERILHVLEATIKWLASIVLASWVKRGAEGDAPRRTCEALVRPPLGKWAEMLRTCLAALPPDDPARRYVERALAEKVSSDVVGLAARTVGAILDATPAYRNALAHGAGLRPDTVVERATGLVALARQVLAAVARDDAPVLLARVESGWVRLVGPTAQLDDAAPAASADDALALLFGDRAIPLTPLWIFDADEDDVLVLNKGAGLAKVEYLSYRAPRGGSGLSVLKGPTADAAKRFLEQATGRTKIDASDVTELVEQSEARELLASASSTRIGPYRIVRRISEGGQGVLYEAIQEDPPRRVALKTLPFQAAIDEASRRRIREEAAALAKVEHPNVVPIFATGESEGTPWIAMKFVDGKSLSEVLGALRGNAGGATLADWNRATSSREDRPDEERRQPHSRRVAELCRDVAGALAACHEKGIVHRDVKPGNVMLDGEGRALLADFGLARPTDVRSQTFTRKIVGTLQYLAPESLLPSGRRGPDARVDVYGLGATLYEALSFRRPFAEYEEDEPALLQAVQQKDPPALRKVAPWIPKDLETIVAKAMEKDRDHRYASAAALAADLTRFLDGRPIIARPTGAITRSVKWAKRHPGKAVAAAAILIAASGGASILEASHLANVRAIRGHLAHTDGAFSRGEWTRALEALAQARDRGLDPETAAERKSAIEDAQRTSDDAQRRAAAFAAAAKAREEAAAADRAYAEAKQALDAKRQDAMKLQDACFTKWAPTAKRAQLSEMERRIKEEEAQLEQLAASSREALERAYRLESPYLDGKPSGETESAFASFFLGLWKVALDASDDAHRRLFEAEVRKHDPAKEHDATLVGRGTLTVNVDPPGATAYLFRYEAYDTVRTDEPVVSRLVPVPTSGIGRCRPSQWIDGFYPGDFSLVIDKVEPGSIAAGAGLASGDHIVKLNGQPCGEGLWVNELKPDGLAANAGVKLLDRIESVDGNAVDSVIDWSADSPAMEGDSPPVKVVIGVKSIDVPRARDLVLAEALGIRAATSRVLVSNPSAPAPLELVCLKSGESIAVSVPQGKTLGAACEVTAYPLILSKLNTIRTGEATPADPGSYVLLVRAEGKENQRFAVVVERGKPAITRLKLLPAGTTPEGYVYVPPGPFLAGGDPEAVRSTPPVTREVDGFFISKLEVTNREWFEFVNDPETLKELDDGRGDVNKWRPRNADRSLIAEKDEKAGKWRAGYGRDETPVLSISGGDIQAYMKWKNKKAEESGDKWRYDLPTEWEWEKAARGADGRRFPWGRRFDFSLCVSGHRGKRQLFHLTGHVEPRDESVFEVWDVGGSRWEWTSSEFGRSDSTYSLVGGSWGGTNEHDFRCANRSNNERAFVNTGGGFRLVARLRL